MGVENWQPGELGAYENRGEICRNTKVAISGSFKRHLEEVGQAIDSFSFLGVEILSPQDNNIVDELEGFVFLDSDQRRSIKGVQNRHLSAIGNADILYVVCPDGYTGQSVCLEIGYAIATGTPVLASSRPEDVTVRQYVDEIAGPAGAIDWLVGRSLRSTESEGLILLDPEQVTATLHNIVEGIRIGLTNRRKSAGDRTEGLIRAARQLLQTPGR